MDPKPRPSFSVDVIMVGILENQDLENQDLENQDLTIPNYTQSHQPE